MHLWLAIFLMSCEDEKAIPANAAPTIAIQSHSDEAFVLETYTERFQALVSDDDDNVEELEVAWYLDNTLICSWQPPSSAGEAHCNIALTPGNATVVAEVRDPQATTGRDQVFISVTASEVPLLTTQCAAAGAGIDSSGNQLLSCLSESGVTGPEISDPQGNVLQSGSVFIYSPE